MAGTTRKTQPHPMPNQEILNIDDAAAFLGVSVKTFSKVLREGDVPGRKVGREWKFSRQALIDWVGAARSSNSLDQADGDNNGSSVQGETVPRGNASRRKPRGPRRGSVGGRAPKRKDGFSVDEL